jgi:hypothetical protein
VRKKRKQTQGRIASYGIIGCEVPQTTRAQRKRVRAKIHRICSECGRVIQITLLKDGSTRGAQYFGDWPFLTLRKRTLYTGDLQIDEEIWRHSHEDWECNDCLTPGI